MRHLFLALAGLALVAGCASAPAAPPATETPPSTPATVTYSKIGVEDQPMSATGLDTDGALDVPDVSDPGRVVWLRWSGRMAPGRPLVVAAHVSGRDPVGAAVGGAFFRLHEASEGDRITVGDTSGGAVNYTVRQVKTVDKDAFPTDEVYGPRPGKWLVAVTCGGRLDRAAHSFDDNVLVFAEALG